MGDKKRFRHTCTCPPTPSKGACTLHFIPLVHVVHVHFVSAMCSQPTTLVHVRVHVHACTLLYMYSTCDVCVHNMQYNVHLDCACTQCKL